ncbi:MAG: hypothetical protein QOE38_2375, partial [Thermoleophilaceae bacterium]|nr:hypothetical protein [Thermoleophilaceae bacterium]
HVRTLADLGLVKLVKRRTRRGAVEHYYQARGRAQVTNRAWAQVPGVVKRSMVAVALEQAVDQAGAAAAAGGFDHEDANLSRESVKLDAEGFGELSAAIGRLHGELAAIQERSAARLKKGGDEDAELNAGLVTMLFQVEKHGGEPKPGGDGRVSSMRKRNSTR